MTSARKSRVRKATSSVPGYDNLGWDHFGHPASAEQPDLEEYGIDSDFGEGVRKGPYEDSPAPASYSWEPDHPAHSKKALKSAMERKAAKCIRIAESRLGKFASQREIEDLALRFMDLPNSVINSRVASIESPMAEEIDAMHDMYAEDIDPMAEEVEGMMYAEDPMAEEVEGMMYAEDPMADLMYDDMDDSIDDDMGMMADLMDDSIDDDMDMMADLMDDSMADLMDDDMDDSIDDSMGMMADLMDDDMGDSIDDDMGMMAESLFAMEHDAMEHDAMEHDAMDHGMFASIDEPVADDMGDIMADLFGEETESEADILADEVASLKAANARLARKVRNLSRTVNASKAEEVKAEETEAEETESTEEKVARIERLANALADYMAEMERTAAEEEEAKEEEAKEEAPKEEEAKEEAPKEEAKEEAPAEKKAYNSMADILAELEVEGEEVEPMAEELEPVAEDPMGLDSVADMQIDARLASIFTAGEETEAEETEAEETEAEETDAGKKASYRPSTQARQASVKTLGNISREASSSDELSKLWESAPDVSKFFG
jgi:hypothetical protein